MEVIYNDILDDISDRIRNAENTNRKIKRFILTPLEFDELKKKCCSYGIDSPDQTIMGIPFEVK
jgi:hypothetical protein